MASPDAPAHSAFTAEQFAQAYADGVQDHYWYKARNRIIARQLAQDVPPADAGAVLDIGCGRGITVEYLRAAGWNALGCDLGNPAPITPAAAPYVMAQSDAFQLPAQLRHSVRCILLLDVLEHLEDPNAFLARCCAEFPACEYVLVSLPARQELWSNYDEHYGHVRRYTLASAAALLAHGSLAALRSGYFFHLLYVPAVLLRAFRMKRNLCIKPPASRLLHRLLAACFAVEERIAPSCVPGTSLYLMLRTVRPTAEPRTSGSP
jgi:SAM-dependent methyltransferase